jgi:zinc and cadmium transporter
MAHESILTILSVIIVSLVSLVGVITLAWKKKFIEKILLFLVSLSAGTLFGGAFLHLLPEATEKAGFTIQISLLVLAGILLFFVLEKFIHWHHSHHEHDFKHMGHHPTHLAPLNLLGDALHNFLDGLIIAGSYFVSIPAGIATTVAVILHEIPQEIADFGVLIYSGMSKWKAVFFNFLSAVVAIIGAIIGIALGSKSGIFVDLIIPIAAGGFIYIAGSNLIPELHKESHLKESFFHLTGIVLGIAIMFLLLSI